MNALKNPVGWFEIHVTDLARAARFYTEVFDRKLTPLSGGDPQIEIMAFDFDQTSHGASGALVRHPMKQPSTQGALVYFSCTDCAEQEKRAVANGGQIYKSKFPIGPNGFISIIGDSEGNAIGLHSFQ